MARSGDVLNAAEASYLAQVFSDPWSKGGGDEYNQMESLSDNMGVVELPFEVRA
jgi:hypothetical protein